MILETIPKTREAYISILPLVDVHDVFSSRVESIPQVPRNEANGFYEPCGRVRAPRHNR